MSEKKFHHKRGEPFEAMFYDGMNIAEVERFAPGVGWLEMEPPIACIPQPNGFECIVYANYWITKKGSQFGWCSGDYFSANYEEVEPVA